MNKNKLIILISIILIALISWFVINKNDSPTKDNGENSETPTNINNSEYATLEFPENNLDTSDWEIYRNKEVGVSFSCPDNLTIRTKVSDGDSGQSFSGFLEFRTGKGVLDGISFGGVTNDFSKSRGGSIKDTTGWREEKYKYYLKFAWGEYEITPSEFIPANNGQTRALIIRDTEIDMLLDRQSIAAFINSPDPLFPRIVFALNPSNDSVLREDDIKLFYDLISSVVFE